MFFVVLFLLFYCVRDALLVEKLYDFLDSCRTSAESCTAF